MKALQGALFSLQKRQTASCAFTEPHDPGMAEAGRALWVPLVLSSSAGWPRAAPGPTSRWGWRSPRKTPHTPWVSVPGLSQAPAKQGHPWDELGSSTAITLYILIYIYTHWFQDTFPCHRAVRYSMPPMPYSSDSRSPSYRTAHRLCCNWHQLFHAPNWQRVPAVLTEVSQNPGLKCRSAEVALERATRCPRLPSSRCPWLHTDFLRSEKG